MSIWKEQQFIKQDDELLEKVDTFFENLKTSKVLEYREGQHTMALDVLDAIQNKEILIIEAGVGIGKSYAYLIPLLYSYEKSENFQGFIISTSTIALEEQLKNAILHLSNELGIDIPVTVAKGKTNYVCLKKLKQLTEMMATEEEKEVYQKLLELALSGQNDRMLLEDVEEVIWNKIHITSCSFQKCPEYAKCPYILEREKFNKKGAIICNHDLLVQNLSRESDEKFLRNPQALIVDEAHQLEDKIRNASVRFLNKKHLENIIFRACEQVLGMDFSNHDTYSELLNRIFYQFRASAGRNLSNNEIEKEDYTTNMKVGFKITPSLQKNIETLIKVFKQIIKMYENYEKELNARITSSEIEEIKITMMLFEDMLKREKSEFIYWVSFVDKECNYIKIEYCPKDIKEYSARLFSDTSYGKVFTSATLTTNGDYSYFIEGLGLDKVKGTSILKEFPQKSPYDYQNNALIYYDDTLPSPDKKEEYLISVSKKVADLVKKTNGKSLVLFTSKSDMRYVYEYLKSKETLDFPVLIQEEGNANKVKTKFMEDEDATLLATGAFWEGIDIKGKSLSNLIIVRLPFPLVDPIVDAKAREYTDGFGKVYLKEMLLKLKQGIGRAIRSSEDTAIISILDSRITRYNERYDNEIFDNFEEYSITNDMNEVKSFIKKKIL